MQGYELGWFTPAKKYKKICIYRLVVVKNNTEIRRVKSMDYRQQTESSSCKLIVVLKSTSWVMNRSSSSPGTCPSVHSPRLGVSYQYPPNAQRRFQSGNQNLCWAGSLPTLTLARWHGDSHPASFSFHGSLCGYLIKQNGRVLEESIVESRAYILAW